MHLLNWHLVPEDRFRLDDPTGDYYGFLDEVESVQQEQMAILCAMKTHVVFYEGQTAEIQIDAVSPYRTAHPFQTWFRCWTVPSVPIRLGAAKQLPTPPSRHPSFLRL